MFSLLLVSQVITVLGALDSSYYKLLSDARGGQKNFSYFAEKCYGELNCPIGVFYVPISVNIFHL